MAKGTIKKLVHEKGFGFITPENGKDVFFHHSTVTNKQFDNLAEGQSVEYDIDQAASADKGPRAATVKPL